METNIHKNQVPKQQQQQQQQHHSSSSNNSSSNSIRTLQQVTATTI